MAIRQIRTIGDEILTKKCKPVKEMTPRTRELIEDMYDTMYQANGVGLAASEQAAAAWGIPPEDTKKLLKML